MGWRTLDRQDTSAGHTPLPLSGVIWRSHASWSMLAASTRPRPTTSRAGRSTGWDSLHGSARDQRACCCSRWLSGCRAQRVGSTSCSRRCKGTPRSIRQRMEVKLRSAAGYTQSLACWMSTETMPGIMLQTLQKWHLRRSGRLQAGFGVTVPPYGAGRPGYLACHTQSHLTTLRCGRRT